MIMMFYDTFVYSTYAFEFFISFVICLVEYDIYNSFKSSTSEF